MGDSTSEVTISDPQKKPKKKKTEKRYALSFFIKVALTALVLWVLLYWVGGVFVCHNNSAYPMIKDGDLCITYRLEKPMRGDVIAYKLNGEIKFGRVIASEGDSVDISADYVSVNGYGIFEDTLYPTKAEGASIMFPYTISDNCVFVLNDYRSDISDSRTFGELKLSDAQGKVVFVVRRRGI